MRGPLLPFFALPRHALRCLFGRRSRALLALLLGAGLLVACGGGGADRPAAVARVDILDGGPWLPGRGASRQLQAQAYDADGNPVEAEIGWSSSRPAHVEVDAEGLATAGVAAGSARIVARAGSVASVPVLAIVAAPAAGVRVVADAQILSTPEDDDPGATPLASNTYRVTLSAAAAPAPGGRLLGGSGDRALAGEVVAVDGSGATRRVTLRLLPPESLFAAFSVVERLDLSDALTEVADGIEDDYVVHRDGNTWSFTPRPDRPAPSARPRPQAVTGTEASNLLPFSGCEFELTGYTEGDELPLSLSAPPTITYSISPSLDLDWTQAGGLRRFVVDAEPSVTLSAGIEGEAAVEGSLECLLQLLAIRLPIGGPAAFFVGGYVPLGVGFELSASTTLASFGVSTSATASADVSIGLACTAGGCGLVRSADNLAGTLEPSVDVPNVFEDARLELGLDAFGWFEAQIGHPLLRSLRFKAFEARAGGKIETDLAPPVVQVLDAGYASDYGAALNFEGKVGVGISDALQLLGLSNFSSLGLELELPLAGSPRAATIVADRQSFSTGDTVNVTVMLDPDSLEFLPGVGNVQSVELRRRVGLVTEVLASQSAAAGQARFEFAITAPAAGDASQWFAFVTTRLLPAELLSLELGPVATDVGLTVVFVSATEGDPPWCQAAAHYNGPDGEEDDFENVFSQPSTCSASLRGASASASLSLLVQAPLLVEGESVPPGALNFGVQVDARAQQSTTNEDESSAARATANAQRTWNLRVGGAPLQLSASGSFIGVNASTQLGISVFDAGQVRIGGLSISVNAPNPQPLSITVPAGGLIFIQLSAVTEAARVSGEHQGSPQSSAASDVHSLSAVLDFAPAPVP